MEKKPKKTRKELSDEQLKELNEKIAELLDDELDEKDKSKLMLTNGDIEAIRIIGKWQIIINILALVAMTGFIKWFNYSNIYMALVLMFIIAGLDSILSLIIDKFFVRMILFSLGSIKLLPSALGFAIAYFLPTIEVVSFGKVVIVYILYNILKKLITIVFKRYIRQRSE